MSCPGASEVLVPDHRLLGARSLFPLDTGPVEPAALLLVEYVKRLITQLGEFRRPPRPAANGVVVEDHADDIDLLAAVDLIPQRLQDLADGGAVGVTPVHQA